jgi:hypothetical protein
LVLFASNFGASGHHGGWPIGLTPKRDTAARVKLPVRNTLVIAFYRVLERRARILKVIALPTLLLFCVSVLIQLADTQAPQFSHFHFVYLLSFLMSIAWALIEISCHRVFLDDPDQPSGVGSILWGSRQWSYIGAAIVAYLPTAASTSILF